jgi:hypothetical protein
VTSLGMLWDMRLHADVIKVGAGQNDEHALL